MSVSNQTRLVLMRALIARINRKLSPDQELKETRGERSRAELGDYYVIDTRMNAVIAKHVLPEAFGRELGCLASWESVDEWVAERTRESDDQS